MAFKDRLKSLRNERGITQEDLANALDMPASTIRRYESSDEGMPKSERIQLIANYFGCTVDYLLERTDERYHENQKESELTLPKSKIENIVNRIEKETGVSISDDPLILESIESTLKAYAQLKKNSLTDR